MEGAAASPARRQASSASPGCSRTAPAVARALGRSLGSWPDRGLCCLAALSPGVLLTDFSCAGGGGISIFYILSFCIKFNSQRGPSRSFLHPPPAKLHRSFLAVRHRRFAPHLLFASSGPFVFRFAFSFVSLRLLFLLCLSRLSRAPAPSPAAPCSALSCLRRSFPVVQRFVLAFERRFCRLSVLVCRPCSFMILPRLRLLRRRFFLSSGLAVAGSRRPAWTPSPSSCSA